MFQNGIYGRLTRFLLPLAITLVAVELGIQVLSAGMARVPQATETLATYGIAWGLILLLSSPLNHAKGLSLVMADSPEARRRVVRFIVSLAALLMIGLAALALTPLGYWVIEIGHSVDSRLGESARLAILWLIPAPLLNGLSNYYIGQLLRARRTVIVSAASIGSISAGIVLVFALLPTPLIQSRPIWLPILATYVNLSVNLVILYWGNWWINQQGDARPKTGIELKAAAEPPTYWSIFQFIWPMAMNISFQEFSRPLINIFIARGPNGVEDLAILTVAYALGQFPYRWLNDLRNLAAAFQDEQDSLLHIKRFSIACGFVSLGMMLGLFWTPLADFILRAFMGLDPEFAAKVRVPLMIFAVFSPIVVLRSYFQGIAMLEKRTHLIAYCAPTRLAAVYLTLVLLPLLGVGGAPLGVAALAMGFLAESLTISWGIQGARFSPRLIFGRSH